MNSQRPTPGLPWTTCPPCQKRAFPDRTTARKAARTQHSRTGRLHAYPCEHGNGYHVGHQPPFITNGTLDRATYEANRTPNQHRDQKRRQP